MSNEKAGAWALILGGIASIALMAAHPTHTEGPRIGLWTLNAIVHSTAILAAPVLLFGAWALSRRIGAPAAYLALAFYALGAVSTLAAATMSGLVMPQLVEAAHTPGAGASGVPFQGLANLTHWINQGFANVHVALMSVAIALWSIAWPLKSPGGVVLRVLGVAIGLGVLAWQASGALTLDVHGMGAVIVLHAVWTFAAAWVLLRAGPS